MMAEVAHRWKTQFNENSKAWAAYDAFPELNHNAVVGYERPTSFLDHVPENARTLALAAAWLGDPPPSPAGPLAPP